MPSDRQLLETAVGLLRRLRQWCFDNNIAYNPLVRESGAFLASIDALASAPRESEARVMRGHCNRCDRCGWPLWEGGCGVTNCSMRPLPDQRSTCAGCGALFNGATPTPSSPPATQDSQISTDPPPVEFHAVGGTPPAEVLEAVRAAYPWVAETCGCKLSVVRCGLPVGHDGDHEARPLTEGERTADDPLEPSASPEEMARRRERARERLGVRTWQEEREDVLATMRANIDFAEKMSLSDNAQWNRACRLLRAQYDDIERGHHIGASPRKAGE